MTARQRDHRSEGEGPNTLGIAPHVDSYRFGRIIVDGEAYTSDLIILPEGVRADWWRQEGHYLQWLDLESVLGQQLEWLVIGQGAFGRMAIAPEVEEALSQAGIQFIARRSGPACETYNQLREEARVAMAIHLTC